MDHAYDSSRNERPGEFGTGRLVRGERSGSVAGMGRSRLPNIVTASRIALMPAVLAAALAGERGWFAGLLAAALGTDVLDGFLARRWNAHSDLGRKLDSIADYVTLFTALAGIWLLWPDVVRREWPWFAAVFGAFFLAMAYCFWRLGRAPCYHTWASKITVAGCAVSLIPLLAGWSSLPSHIVASLQVLVGVEEIAIATLVPWHRGEMPSVWHAWKLRQARAAAERRAFSPRGGAAES